VTARDEQAPKGAPDVLGPEALFAMKGIVMNTSKYVLPLLLAPLLALGTAAQAQAQAQAPLPKYQVTRLPSGLVPIDINNAGTIIGFMSTNFGEHSFILQQGTVTDLGTLTGPTGQFTSAARLNSAGYVTGWSINPAGQQRAFLYFQGSMQDLGTLGGNHSAGNAINDAGTVVGWSEFDSTDSRHAFAWSRGTRTDLGTLGGSSSSANAINNLGVIVGESGVSLDPGTDTRPFIYRNGVMTDLGSLGGSFASALAINESNQVAGHATLPDGTFTLFLYENGNLRNLGSLGGFYAQPFDINNGGTIVGIAEPPGSSIVAFLYAQNRLVTVDSLIDPALGWQIIFARSINDRGQIVGFGCREQICGPVRLDPMP
jgi:probable HAF family extracellular repeat protein